MARNLTWTLQDDGWYVSEIGGIHEEVDGWAFWPDDFSIPAILKLPSVGAAMAEAERQDRVRNSE